MIKIFDNKLWRDGQRIGHIDDHRIFDHDNRLLGYVNGDHVFDARGRKIGRIEGNYLKTDEHSFNLQDVHAQVAGDGHPDIIRCGVLLLIED